MTTTSGAAKSVKSSEFFSAAPKYSPVMTFP